MKKKIAPFVENIAESGAACLVTMVQGNLLLLGLGHWLTATQTGLLAGTAAATAITLAKAEGRLLIAGILGVTTAVVDYFVHPGSIGDGAALEAVITGLGAAALSFATGTVIHLLAQRRRSSGERPDSPPKAD